MYTLFIRKYGNHYVPYTTEDSVKECKTLADMYFNDNDCEIRDGNGLIVARRSRTSNWETI